MLSRAPSQITNPQHTTTIRTYAPGTPSIARPYDRERDLPGLLPVWPREIRDMTPEKHHRLIQRLKRALREERRRGIAGSWTYDLARHARLFRALQAEMAATPPPLSSWATATYRNERDGDLAAGLARDQGAVTEPAELSRGACQVPSSSRVASAPRRNSARPSDSREEAATWPGTLQATSCSASASGASAI